MLAKSLDYDELDYFRQFLMAGGKRPSFKWSSSDRAGTIPLPTLSANPSEALSNIIQGMMKKKGAMPTSGGRQAAERVAAGQGREVAYICPDGTTRDALGQMIERSRDHIPYSFRLEGEFEKWLSDLSTVRI